MQKQIPMKRNPPISHLLFILLSFHPTGKKAPLRGAFFLLFFLRPLRRGAQTPPVPHTGFGGALFRGTAFHQLPQHFTAPSRTEAGWSPLPGTQQRPIRLPPPPRPGPAPPHRRDFAARHRRREDKQFRRATLHQVPHPDPALHRPFQNRGRLNAAPAARGNGQSVCPRLPGQDQLLPTGRILPPEAADGRTRNEDRQSRRAALH